MRTLKFRAYDKKEKKWLWPYPDGFHIIGEVTVFDMLGNCSMSKYIDFEIVQWTGLYDNTKWEDLTTIEHLDWIDKGQTKDDWKGKEIYEGDIIAPPNFDCKAIVKFGEYNNDRAYEENVCGYGWYYETIEDNQIWDMYDLQMYKIKGNIYENPELLKGE
ncbi:hypothetical protein LCGC14_2926580 [marine sediment metagenome]|uniref:YopX protein domain-containing protein n=1 Tax=marine sediment metagenome TaxID=412755 RepID=A0A0F9AD85_9ZZZZ